jgi:hypothetical protein
MTIFFASIAVLSLPEYIGYYHRCSQAKLKKIITIMSKDRNSTNSRIYLLTAKIKQDLKSRQDPTTVGISNVSISNNNNNSNLSIS